MQVSPFPGHSTKAASATRRVFSRVLLLSGLAALQMSLPAQAQTSDYPAKPIRIVVPYPPGGNSDNLARLVAKELSDSFGSSVYVDNRPGAGGSIGVAAVVNSAPDGYSILFTTSNITVDQSLRPNLPYKPDVDLVPITKVVSAPLILMINPDVPVSNVQELVDYGKAKPQSLFYATYGVGATNHIVSELFKLETGIKMDPVPFKGSADALPALVSNLVQVNFEVLAQGIPLAQAGKAKILAITAPTRDAKSPETPTMAESGFPSFEASIWFGLFAPKGTPSAIVDSIQSRVAKALARPDIKERLAQMSFNTEGNSPAEFAAQVASENEKWKNVISRAGIKISE